MKPIQILGTGSPEGIALAKNVAAALRELGIQAPIEQVADMDQITTFRVMATPALVVDGPVRVVGRVPTVEEIKTLLAGGAGETGNPAEQDEA